MEGRRFGGVCFAWLWICWPLCVASCQSCDAPSRDGQDAGPVSSASVVAPRPTVVSSVGPWDEAAGGDELAAIRLAELHTAPELLAIARGGPQEDVALGALAHAQDAELALRGLCTLARDGIRGERVLGVIGAIAARPTRSTEPLDPDGLRACVEVLDAMSRDAQSSRGRRVLAVNALRGFARAGYVAFDRIVTELDSP